MASKQAKAKAEQNYQEKPVWPICSNCLHYRSEFESIEKIWGAWTKEINIQCAMGRFKVKKQATCDKHTPVVTP